MMVLYLSVYITTNIKIQYYSYINGDGFVTVRYTVGYIQQY